MLWSVCLVCGDNEVINTLLLLRMRMMMMRMAWCVSGEQEWQRGNSTYLIIIRLSDFPIGHNTPHTATVQQAGASSPAGVHLEWSSMCIQEQTRNR